MSDAETLNQLAGGIGWPELNLDLVPDLEGLNDDIDLDGLPDLDLSDFPEIDLNTIPEIEFPCIPEPDWGALDELLVNADNLEIPQL